MLKTPVRCVHESSRNLRFGLKTHCCALCCWPFLTGCFDIRRSLALCLTLRTLLMSFGFGSLQRSCILAFFIFSLHLIVIPNQPPTTALHHRHTYSHRTLSSSPS